MVSSRAAQAKQIIKARLPMMAPLWRSLRRVPGLRPPGRRRLTRYIQEQTRSVVASGPFRGMRLLDGASWGDGDLAPKLLGTYEQELHEAIERCRGRSYGAIVDLGCAEGYYAVGLARLFPDLPVFAFDTDETALAIARRTAAANGVEERVAFGGFCDWASLEALAVRYRKLLVISDCEGHEVELFGHGDRQSLAWSDLIVECHDRIRPGSTAAMTESLAGTHDVRRVDAIGRNPNQFAFLTEMHESDRWLAVSENRPYCSHWLACEHRAA